MSTSKLSSDRLQNSEQQIRSQVSQLTQLLTVTTTQKFPLQWNVKLSHFQGAQLTADLAQINQQFGYDYIELQLDFSKDLYPFFPPLVKV